MVSTEDCMDTFQIVVIFSFISHYKSYRSFLGCFSTSMSIQSPSQVVFRRFPTRQVFVCGLLSSGVRTQGFRDQPGISSQRIANWLKMVLKEAGIDTSVFSACTVYNYYVLSCITCVYLSLSMPLCLLYHNVLVFTTIMKFPT